ncbi:MAG TPA: cytochrome d ubiquinol oxidase subunit II [Baekduia sp.]
MSAAGALMAVLWVTVTGYALLGGADFGAGILHLLTPTGARGRHVRGAIGGVIGPVWEANHVWLILFITGLLTIFPVALAALGSALFAPATIALLGLVVRGAAFAFAGQLTAADGVRRPLQRLFGLASVLTPAMLGAVAGGLARQRLVVVDGTVRAGGGAGLWVGPFQALIAVLAVATCAATAASFLVVEMARAGEMRLAARFRRQATWALLASALLAVAALLLSADEAPALHAGLVGRAAPIVLGGPVVALAALVALRAGRDRLARAAVALFVVALVWGWGVAQFPRIVGPSLTVDDAAAAPAELHAIAIALAAGAALLVPALALLYGAWRREPPEVHA